MSRIANHLTSIGTLAALAMASAGFAGSADAAPVGLPNPAAAFCVEKGGTYQIENRATGARSICRFADGRVVDAWEFYRPHHPSPSAAGPRPVVLPNAQVLLGRLAP
jgi:putative hemolysin